MNTPICIITGSTLGGAEYLAEHIENILQMQGYTTELFHGASYEEVIEKSLWLIITSTHGAGELPDNLKPLFEQIKAQAPNLSQLKFAVIGLGNSDYDTFCGAVDEVEHTLKQQSAVQICESLRIDVVKINDIDQYAEDWLPCFTSTIKEMK